MAKRDTQRRYVPHRQPSGSAVPSPDVSDAASSLNPVLAEQRTVGNQVVQRQLHFALLPTRLILGQQQTLGNQAVQRLLQSRTVQVRRAVTLSGVAQEHAAAPVARVAMDLPRGRVTPGVVQRRISPADVSAEMVGQAFEVTGSFTSGAITLSGREQVIVVSWDNASPTVQVRLPTPFLHAGTPFDIPKRLLRPVAPAVTGMAPYSAGVGEAVKALKRGEQAIVTEQTRKGGPRPGEIPRLEGLQQNRERLLNQRLIQETMFNRFDPIIKQWTDHYNQQFKFSGAKALDPNLVKSILFQESQLGTAGQHLEDPPSGWARTRFNIGQVIDSAAPALLIMMKELQPDLITTFHLENIEADLAAAQQDLRILGRRRTRTPAQQARLDELLAIRDEGRALGLSFGEIFMRAYKAPGQTEGFNEAVNRFFRSVASGPARNFDYEFWIRTAIRWLFEKRKSVKSWEEAARAYNGTGKAAEHYREAVTKRAQEATAAQKGGGEFVPGKI